MPALRGSTAGATVASGSYHLQKQAGHLSRSNHSNKPNTLMKYFSSPELSKPRQGSRQLTDGLRVPVRPVPPNTGALPHGRWRSNGEQRKQWLRIPEHRGSADPHQQDRHGDDYYALVPLSMPLQTRTGDIALVQAAKLTGQQHVPGLNLQIHGCEPKPPPQRRQPPSARLRSTPTLPQLEYRQGTRLRGEHTCQVAATWTPRLQLL